MDKILVRRREAAGMLSYSLPTLDELIREGRIAAVRVGRSVRIPVTALREFAESASGRN